MPDRNPSHDPIDAFRPNLLRAVDKALTYDYLQDRTADPNSLAGVVAEHLTAGYLNHYLVQRSVVKLLEHDLQSGQLVLLVGANGSGKTSVLIALRHRLLSNRGPLGRLVPIVFNGNANAAALSSLRTEADKRQYILTKVAQALLRKALTPTNTLRLDWQDHLRKFEPFFASFNSHYHLQHTTNLSDVLADDRAADDWANTYERWASLPVLSRLPRLVEYLRERGDRLVFIIDNCDYLTNDDLAAAGVVTRDLHAYTKMTTGVIVAVRPYTLDRAKARMNIVDARERYVNSFERILAITDNTEGTEGGWTPTPSRVQLDLYHTYQIFQRRLSIFEDNAFLYKLSHYLTSKPGIDIDKVVKQANRIVRNFRNAAKTVLMDYFNFDGLDGADYDTRSPEARYEESAEVRNPGPLTPEAKEDLTRIFTMWHNGSIRELGSSLKQYIIRQLGPEHFSLEATQENLQTADSSLLSRKGNPRTQLFRHLLYNETGLEDLDMGEFPEIHPAFRLFAINPSFAETKFYFHNARILQYLHTYRFRPERQTVASVRQVLGEFKVHPDSVDHALMDLAYRRGYGSGLIRIDKLVLDENENAASLTATAQVEILPAGSILISRLVYVVEFQYWSAVGESAARADVAHALNLVESTLVDQRFLSTMGNRARVALGYLSRVLTPRFQRDHSYMVLDTSIPSTTDRQRLRQFARYFGFGLGDWHLTRAARQVERFVLYGRRDVNIHAALAAIAPDCVVNYDYIIAMSKQLDRVYGRK